MAESGSYAAVFTAEVADILLLCPSGAYGAPSGSPANWRPIPSSPVNDPA